MVDSNHAYDVLVIGGGNAALCAAITARRAGAKVLVLECATKDFRGGNSRHTRDIRYMHRAATDFVTSAYDASSHPQQSVHARRRQSDDECLLCYCGEARC
jgi:tricarballylate dehydrogenase